jgi:hypothetical protein
MSRTPARFTQADIARAIRAAQQTGAGAIFVLPDGTIRIQPTREPLAHPPAASGIASADIDDDEVIPLT